jgi:hypothetical protein
MVSNRGLSEGATSNRGLLEGTTSNRGGVGRHDLQQGAVGTHEGHDLGQKSFEFYLNFRPLNLKINGIPIENN